MKVVREIPDPEGDHRYMAVITIDGFGKATQLDKDIRRTLNRLLWEEFGDMAKLTSMTRTDHDVVITDDKD